MPIIDFAIITGLIEEFDALKKIFPPFDEDSENSRVYYRTVIPSTDGKKKYHTVITFQNQMGSFDAIGITKNFIKDWSPAYIILVGIAGSFNEKVKLGDIIVSQQVFHYDYGKIVDKEKETEIEYRPQGYPCSVALIRQAEAFVLREKNWIKNANKSARKKAKKLKQEYPKFYNERLDTLQRKLKKNNNKSANSVAAKEVKKQMNDFQKQFDKTCEQLMEHNPNVHFGTVASGSLVVASPKKRQELLKLHGKIIGTEMEGAGVMHATYYEESPVPAIVIKSISDAADAKKAETDKIGCWREMALENSSNFLFGLLSSGKFRALNTDQFKLDLTTGATALACDRIKDSVSPGNGAFLSFPKLVVPCGPLTKLKIEITVEGKNEQLNINKLVVEYLDWHQKKQSISINSGVCELSGPILQSSIGLYLLASGTPKSILFSVKAFNFEREEYWHP